MHTTETGIFYTFFTLMGVLLTLVSYYLFSVYSQQKRHLQEIRGQVMRDMLLIEQERTRISKDLHDDLGSLLASVRKKLDNMEKIFPDNRLISQTVIGMDRSLVRIKEIAHNLMPGILLHKGLCAALTDLVDDLNALNMMHVHFNNDCDDRAFEPNKSIILYRVVQEIFSNVIKHSGASSVIFNCSCQEHNLILEIKDNGKGFDMKRLVLGQKNFGLKNIHSRLALLNAHYKIDSSPGNGTYIFVNIPIIVMRTYYEPRNTHQDYYSRGS